MVMLAYKITAMVATQIVLIIASFLIIVHFESQAYHTGNIVNVAGKSRVLTILVHNELVGEMLQYGQLRDGRGAISALEDLKYNILFLKEGGIISGITTDPLSPKFHGEWVAIWDKFGQYEGLVSGFVSVEVGTDGNASAVPLETRIGDIRRTGDELVMLSDALTDNLGRDVDAHSSNLILLQVMLGTINVAVHIIMIILIWRIFNRHAEQRIRMEKFAVLGEFAAMMAHNIKNPLGTILNSATMIRLRSNDANSVGFASVRIERAVRQMSRQIDGVMNYARDVPFETTTESVRDMLDRSLELVPMPSYIRMNLPEEDMQVTCDPEKMEITFANILLNAVQAMGDDDGYITVRLAEDAGDDGASAVIVFENSGPNIPEKDLETIFEPLFTTKMRGTGLGLASCRNIVNRHGGSITASNGPVRFTLRIPRILAADTRDEGGDHND